MGTQHKLHSFEKFLQMKGKRRVGIPYHLRDHLGSLASPAVYWRMQDLMCRRESGMYLICSSSRTVQTQILGLSLLELESCLPRGSRTEEEVDQALYGRGAKDAMAGEVLSPTYF